MHKKVKADYKFAERELETLKFWKENNILAKSIKIREGAPSFTFFDGPPTANGMPHIGHVLTRVVKDIIPRYKTMKGFKVLRKAGWDTHGLPVELEVEKQLGIDGKEDIEKHGVEDFIHDCNTIGTIQNSGSCIPESEHLITTENIGWQEKFAGFEARR